MFGRSRDKLSLMLDEAQQRSELREERQRLMTRVLEIDHYLGDREWIAMLEDDQPLPGED